MNRIDHLLLTELAKPEYGEGLSYGGLGVLWESTELYAHRAAHYIEAVNRHPKLKKIGLEHYRMLHYGKRPLMFAELKLRDAGLVQVTNDPYNITLSLSGRRFLEKYPDYHPLITIRKNRGHATAGRLREVFANIRQRYGIPGYYHAPRTYGS